jgi:hypothetical protein
MITGRRKSGMRSLTFVLAAMCLIGLLPVAALGQESALGLKGGLNVSTLSIEDPAQPDLEVESQTGLVLGAYLECGGESWFALQGEVNYSQNGAKVRGGSSATRIDLDYIRVPVLIMARIGQKESTLYPLVYAGPQLAFQVSCGVEADSDGESQSYDCNSEELEDPLETRNVEFGLVFGGGVEYLIGGFKMELDARYNLGLTNMNGGTNASVASLKNRGWSFTVGLGKLLK